MAVLMDLECSKCHRVFLDRLSSEQGQPHGKCAGSLQWLPTLDRGPDPGTHSSEKVVVYQSLKEGGKIQYPGRTDVPVPGRLRARGYERVELNVQDLGRFERRHGVANERRHFDRNGRGF